MHRLGMKGWLILLQLAVWYGLFLQFAPLHPRAAILLLWGVATPLAFSAASGVGSMTASRPCSAPSISPAFWLSAYVSPCRWRRGWRGRVFCPA